MQGSTAAQSYYQATPPLPTAEELKACQRNLVQKHLLRPYEEQRTQLWDHFAQESLTLLKWANHDLEGVLNATASTIGRIYYIDQEMGTSFLAQKINQLFQDLADLFLAGRKDAFYSLTEMKPLNAAPDALILRPHLLLQFIRFEIFTRDSVLNRQLRIKFKDACIRFLTTFKGHGAQLDREIRILISRVLAESLPPETVKLPSEQAVLLDLYHEWFKNMRDDPDTQKIVGRNFNYVTSSELREHTPFIFDLMDPRLARRTAESDDSDEFGGRTTVFSLLVKDYYRAISPQLNPSQPGQQIKLLTALMIDSMARQNIDDPTLFEVLGQESWAYHIFGDELFLKSRLPLLMAQKKFPGALLSAINNMLRANIWRQEYREEDLLERFMPFAKTLVALSEQAAHQPLAPGGKLDPIYYPAMQRLIEFCTQELRKLHRTIERGRALSENDEKRLKAFFDIMAFLGSSVGNQDNPTLALYYEVLATWTKDPNVGMATSLITIYHAIYPQLKNSPDFIKRRFFTRILAQATGLPLEERPGLPPRLVPLQAQKNFIAIRALSCSPYIKLYPGDQLDEELTDFYTSLVGPGFASAKNDQQRLDAIRRFILESNWLTESLALKAEDQDPEEAFTIAYGAILDFYPPFWKHHFKYHQHVLQAIHDYTSIFKVLPPSSHYYFLLVSQGHFLWPNVIKMLHDPFGLKHFRDYWYRRYPHNTAQLQDGELFIGQAAELDILGLMIGYSFEALPRKAFIRELGRTLAFIDKAIIPWYRLNPHNAWLELLRILHQHLAASGRPEEFITQLQQHLLTYAGDEVNPLYQQDPAEILANPHRTMELILQTQLTNMTPASHLLGGIFAQLLGLTPQEYQEYVLAMGNHLIAHALQDLETTFQQHPTKVASIRLGGILHNLYHLNYIDPQMPDNRQIQLWALHLLFERVRPGSTRLVEEQDQKAYFRIPPGIFTEELQSQFDAYEYWQIQRMLNHRYRSRHY